MGEIYSGPFVDAHHHLWSYDRVTYPWLLAPGFETLRRDFGALAYRAATATLDVRQTVWIEAMAVDPVAEAATAQRVNGIDPGLCGAIVAHARLDATDCERRLDTLQATVPNLRGIRDIVAAKPGDAFPARRSNPLRSAAFETGLRAVADRGLAFDLLVEAPQLCEAASLMQRLPSLQVIVEHAGSPSFATPADAKTWRTGLRRLADLPNVAIKISALHCRQPNWTDADLAAHILAIIDLFGPDRVAFGSDFPVHDRTCSLERAYLSFRRAVRDLSPEAQRAVFHDTAAGLYKMGHDQAAPLRA